MGEALPDQFVRKRASTKTAWWCNANPWSASFKLENSGCSMKESKIISKWNNKFSLSPSGDWYFHIYVFGNFPNNCVCVNSHNEINFKIVFGSKTLLIFSNIYWIFLFRPFSASLIWVYITILAILSCLKLIFIMYQKLCAKVPLLGSFFNNPENMALVG